MTNLFTCLSKKSLSIGNGSGLHRDCIGHESAISCKLFTSIIFLLFLGVSHAWGTETTLAAWSFTSGTAGTNYPSNNTNFGATSGTMSTNSTFCMNGSGSTWNDTKGYAFTSVSTVVVTLKLNQKLAAGAQITLAADVYYNKAKNAPVTSYAITTKVGSAAASNTGVGTTSWSLSTSSTNKTSTYTTQAEIASGTTIQFILTASGSAGSGQAYFNNVTIKSTTYTVTYNANSGTGSVPTDATAYCYKAIVTVKGNTGPVSRSGYDFGGWNTNTSGTGTNYTAGSGTFTITANTTLYAKWTSAASCESNPSIGDASLNGSFNMTTTTSAIGVASGTCSTGNAACDWTDYGFVWSDGANTTTPTVSNNKVQVNTTGSATSWTGSVTPSGSTTPTSWTTGHTYYVRTYGKNSKASASYYYGSAWSFTPYLVTFYKNDGGATTSTQYVQGGVSTNLTSNSFSRTGYTFNGWNTDADGTSGTGYTDGQSVNLSANLTLYAKWNAKTTAITLSKNNSDGGSTDGSVNYTYAESTKDSYSTATRTGYTLNGYYTATSGGTKILNADGTIAGNSIVVSAVNYTDASGNWAYDGTSLTLYAQWTAINYTVTWKVNNVAWTPKTTTGKGTDGSDNADYGTKVSTLPTAPDPDNDEGCGNKFMGWTNAAIDGSQNSAPAVLFTTAGSSPTITGNTIFHAVFADYGE